VNGRADGDLSFDFFGLEIHAGGALIHTAEPGSAFPVKKHGLSQGGLAGAHVGDQTHVPQLFALSFHSPFLSTQVPPWQGGYEDLQSELSKLVPIQKQKPARMGTVLSFQFRNEGFFS
jgi:hypothetical protein